MLATQDDTLAQNAAYHMADCYLQLDDKPRAKQAFRTAAMANDDLGIQEDAFFNYAKLAFELSFNPFDDAIVAFETYLSQFPTSPTRRSVPFLASGAHDEPRLRAGFAGIGQHCRSR